MGVPTVAIAHTTDKCRSAETVTALVEEAIEHLGGISAFVKPGQTVLIQPAPALPYAAVEGATTDPALVGAIVRLARRAAAGKIRIASTSGGDFDAIECMRLNGMTAMAAREGAEIADLNDAATVRRELRLPDAKTMDRASVPAALVDVDVIIAVPKAKNDFFDLISGAMKMWSGVCRQNSRYIPDSDAGMIAASADLMTALRPGLCIADALVCGEGDGPVATMPHWCGCVLASTDPVALDAAIAGLLGHDVRRLRFAAAGEDRQLGRREPVVWLGIPLERVAFHAWPVHETFDYLPVNVLSGGGVMRSGTAGHVKTALDVLMRHGSLERAIARNGVPTLMIGDAADPDFERHLKEGPYVVFDDAARPEYQKDPRVRFVPGHPVLHGALRHLIEVFGAEWPGPAAAQ